MSTLPAFTWLSESDPDNPELATVKLTVANIPRFARFAVLEHLEAAAYQLLTRGLLYSQPDPPRLGEGDPL